MERKKTNRYIITPILPFQQMTKIWNFHIMSNTHHLLLTSFGHNSKGPLGPNGNQVIGSNQQGTFTSTLQPILQKVEKSKNIVYAISMKDFKYGYGQICTYAQMDHFPIKIFVCTNVMMLCCC